MSRPFEDLHHLHRDGEHRLHFSPEPGPSVALHRDEAKSSFALDDEWPFNRFLVITRDIDSDCRKPACESETLIPGHHRVGGGKWALTRLG